MKPSAELGERLGVLVRDHVERQLAPLRDRIADIEQKSRDAMSFKGVFQRALHYTKGDCVVSDGSLWFCIADTEGGQGKPGAHTAAKWQTIGVTRAS